MHKINFQNFDWFVLELLSPEDCQGRFFYYLTMKLWFFLYSTSIQNIMRTYVLFAEDWCMRVCLLEDKGDLQESA